MNHKFSVGRIIKYLLLIILSLISIFPFVFMIFGMTSDTINIVQGNLMIGDHFVKNMTDLFTNSQNFFLSLLNSAVVALITTAFALLISSAAGYGFEIYRTKGRDIVFNILLLSMMIPFAALMIPLFRMFSNLNGTPFGLDTMFVIIVPLVSTAFLIFFFRQNTKSFPKEMLEAARIDGVGEIGIFFKIFLPTVKNTYAAAAIIVFMNSWNNYLWPLVAIQSPSNRTVPLVLSAMGASYTPEYGMIMCGIVIATLPTAIVFFVMQKQFVQGMMGSVK